jgi:hypothetical protein
LPPDAQVQIAEQQRDAHKTKGHAKQPELSAIGATDQQIGADRLLNNEAMFDGAAHGNAEDRSLEEIPTKVQAGRHPEFSAAKKGDAVLQPPRPAPQVMISL